MTDSAWIRECGVIRLPPLEGVAEIVVEGEVAAHPALPAGAGVPSLACLVEGRRAAQVATAGPGPWRVALPLPSHAATRGAKLSFQLHGIAWTNFLAWLGRVTGVGTLQPYRAQNKNRQLRVTRIATAEGEVIYDFGNRHAPYSPAFARRHARIGMNIVGYLTADLGVGESARCMVRAADAAGLPSALVDLKLPVKSRRGDDTYATRLQSDNPHGVNVVHLDPPGARDIDHHHGRGFRAGKYNIGYWAWELPEFPDAWVPYCDFYEEIWCPSDFVRAAVEMKAPVPVLTMPHAIQFARPAEPSKALRARFGLPADKFLFLFLYDLNSYSARKNPQAVLAAFRASGLASQGASLVIKTHSANGNAAELAALRAAVADLPGTTLITETLSRTDLYRLEAACDCFVSLHRSEGFGLAVAECMYLGKPVIATDWSATAEYLNATNGWPVRASVVTLDKTVGPYAKGQTWAAPEVAHAAEGMQRLFTDSALRARLGDAAQRTIEDRFAPATIGARYRHRLESIATF